MRPVVRFFHSHKEWRGSAFGGNQSTTASAQEKCASGGSRKCEMSTLYGRPSFPIRHAGVGSDGSWIYRRYADSPRLEAQHLEVGLGTYAAAPALGAVGGFSAWPLLGAAGGGEVDPE